MSAPFPHKSTHQEYLEAKKNQDNKKDQYVYQEEKEA
jgi:hypothetical protein